MLTHININLAERDCGAGITMGLALLVKAHEYKFCIVLSKASRWDAVEYEKHITVFAARFELVLCGTNSLFGILS